MNDPLKPLSALWIVLAACAISLGWLLPNHFLPWPSFHADAISAIVFGLMGGLSIAFIRGPSPWHGISCACALLILVPFAQYLFGQIPFAGEAWICSAYLVGLLTALLVGARWEARRPIELGDILFLAFAIAAIVSVGLELYQWFRFSEEDSEMDIWVLYLRGPRMYANMGQPNLLATLLVWGLLAAAWGYCRGKMRAVPALLMAAWIALGLTLTQSRTGLLEVAALVAAAWVWRRAWPTRRFPLAATALAVLLAVFIALLEPVSNALMLDTRLSGLDRTVGDERPGIWRLFFDASLRHPWQGYGWNQVRTAQLDVILDHPKVVGLPLAQAHNILLDLLLWNGWPLGLVVIGVLAWWMWSRMRRVASAQDALLFMVLFTIGLHAMVELPLYYAYFLLPAGLIVGMLNARLAPKPLFMTGRAALGGIWFLSVALLALIIIDYAEVEDSFTRMRFEKAHIVNLPVGPPADVYLLTQMRDLTQYVRSTPQRDLSEAEIQKIRDLAAAYPSIDNLTKLAAVLAINNQPAEAQLWLKRTLVMAPTAQLSLAKLLWTQAQKTYPEAAALPWPAGE